MRDGERQWVGGERNEKKILFPFTICDGTVAQF